jgi:hypothetical protein
MRVCAAVEPRVLQAACCRAVGITPEMLVAVSEQG